MQADIWSEGQPRVASTPGANDYTPEIYTSDIAQNVTLLGVHPLELPKHG